MDNATSELIAAFRLIEQVENGVALVDDDGFDTETARVLAAWMTSEHTFKALTPIIPDGGKPTAKSWAWLVSGMRIDYVAIADAADVSTSVARSRLALLLGNRLIYPDGSCAKVARDALKATLAMRVRRAARKASGSKQNESKQSEPKSGTDAN